MRQLYIYWVIFMKAIIIGVKASGAEMWYGSLAHWLYFGIIFFITCFIVFHSRRQPTDKKDWIKIFVILFVLWQLDWWSYKLYYHTFRLEPLQIQFIIAFEVWIILFFNRKLIRRALDPTKSILGRIKKKLEEMDEKSQHRK